MLFAARALMGLGSGGLWIGVTFATLAYWPGQEYLCMSRIYAAYSAGALLGPALGALGGTSAPFLAYAALLAVLAPAAAGLPRVPATAFASDRAALRSRRSGSPLWASCSRFWPPERWTGSCPTVTRERFATLPGQGFSTTA
jgi:MFS family permease